MNKVILMGRLTRDPEVSSSTSGTTFARYSIAVDRRFKREGEPDADFFNCTSFGKQAEFVERYLKKGTKVEQFYQYVSNAKKAGLLIHACYMVGNQGETRETMQQTLKLALKLNTDTAQFFPLIPYPGTEAYQWAKQNGYIELDYAKYCMPDGTHNTVLSTPELSAQEMVDFCNMARKKYYLRPSYILHRLKVGLTNPDDFKRSLKAFGRLKHYLFK